MTDPTPPPDDASADALARLREIPSRYREALAPHTAEPPPEAVEHAAHARDVLDAAARQVERLVEDSKPLADPTGDAPPKRGPRSVDAGVVLDVLDTNAERLADLVEAVRDGTAGRAPAVQEGLQLISGELASEAVTESEQRLRDAQGGVEDNN